MRYSLTLLFLALTQFLLSQDYGTNPNDAGFGENNNYVAGKAYDLLGRTVSEGIVYYDALRKQI